MLTPPFAYTPLQQDVIHADGTNFLRGTAGTGKSSALHGRLLHLLAGGEPAYTLLMLVAEPEQRERVLAAVHQSGLGPYADLQIINYNKLAMEMVALFWPLVARKSGFSRPYQPPTFLSYDLAQLQMWQIITPLPAEGAFADLRLRPQQIVSQLLDTLNRAALNGLNLEAALARQQTTWSGEPERLVHLADAAKAAHTFQERCREQSLLDLSLAVRVFDTQLVHDPVFTQYFRERFRHLLVDNVEEQTPAGQNFIRLLMNETASTHIAYDAGGGYKRFLAADPHGARQFQALCDGVFQFTDNFVASPAMSHIAHLVGGYLPAAENQVSRTAPAAETGILGRVDGRYRREMILNLVDKLRELLEDHHLQPADVAIITPYLDGALRYMLTRALRDADLPYFLLRRRSPPQDEPRVRAWLTWLALAFPAWQMPPSRFDVAEAFTLSLHDFDPARAALLAHHMYLPAQGVLLPAAECPPRIRDRVGAEWLTLYEQLRGWLAAQEPDAPIDRVLHALFNDLLAQPSFQPGPDLAAAAVCDWLVRTATRLRQAAGPLGLETATAVGRAFLQGIQQGLVTADPPDLGEPPDPNGIMISTIYGYLLAGRPLPVQVWLETSALGWWDIPNQPLNNAFVLAPGYDPGRPWTMADDGAVRNELLTRIIRGLTARCSRGVVLATSELDRRGVRQDGPLWRALRPLWE